MKLILIAATAFLIFTAPVFSELTAGDLEKIRSIVKDEVTSSEKQIKGYIDQKIETVNVKISEMDKRLNQIFWLVIALIGLIVVVVGIPQIFVAARGKEQKELSGKIEELQQEIVTLKQQRILRA